MAIDEEMMVFPQLVVLKKFTSEKQVGRTQGGSQCLQTTIRIAPLLITTIRWVGC